MNLIRKVEGMPKVFGYSNMIVDISGDFLKGKSDDDIRNDLSALVSLLKSEINNVYKNYKSLDKEGAYFRCDITRGKNGNIYLAIKSEQIFQILFREELMERSLAWDPSSNTHMYYYYLKISYLDISKNVFVPEKSEESIDLVFSDCWGHSMPLEHFQDVRTENCFYRVNENWIPRDADFIDVDENKLFIPKVGINNLRTPFYCVRPVNTTK